MVVSDSCAAHGIVAKCRHLKRKSNTTIMETRDAIVIGMTVVTLWGFGTSGMELAARPIRNEH